jgi:hypothetical protein
MRLIFTLSLLILFLTFCKKSGNNLINGSGTWTGSDTTCGGWLIRASDDILYRPLNLDSFTVTKKDGLAVLFTYYEYKGLGSGTMICERGTPIVLTSIADQ